ncbi:DMT family transporter [Stenomitos frigidus]|uniref:DMT family transporter n=1 Tax=Stenomitos frigidus TaxID=1886765 RepID=UPI001FE341C9|nr:EamA family transporter [Stenomitos frigidus]
MSKPEPARWTALLALLALALIWGYNWVQMKIAVQYAPPFQFAALRITLGALSLLLALVWLRKPLLPKEIPATFWAGVLQISGVYGFATWALVSGSAGRTSVLVYTMPLWTLLFAWLFLRERVRGLQWVAIALSITGLLLILDIPHLHGTIASKVLALLAGVCWAGGAIIAKRVRQTVKLDLLSFTAWQTVAGAVPLIVAALLAPSTPIVWSSPFIIALLYNVIPGTAIATLLWLYVLNRLSAGTAGLGVLLNPVVGVMAAWLQLGEQPTLLEAAGMGFIAIALALNALQAMKPSPQVAA